MKAGHREGVRASVPTSRSRPADCRSAVKGLPVGEDEVSVICTDQSAHDCSGADGDVEITVTYTRIVELPYLKGRFVTLHFSDSAKETLKPVEW